jgi:beta-glucosidase
VITAINAGIDMVMVPFDYKQFIATLTAVVESGHVPMTRIDDAVRRILRVKAWAGLFDAPFGRDDLLPAVGSTEHRQVAREAVRKSLVLLKNDDHLLPLRKDESILVGGRGADNLGMQCGGWSITWQGDHGGITVGTTLLTGIQQAVEAGAEIAYSADGSFMGGEKFPVGIAFVGESPYAEGLGDSDNLFLSVEDTAVIQRMRQQCSKLVVVVLSGRPLVITDILAQADALVAAWLPGTEGQGAADVLFGDYPFVGRLSFSWPRSVEQVPLKALHESGEPPLFPLGFGLS